MARYLTIEDGREYLWDFDENRVLLVTYGDTENIKQVEFSTDDTEGPTTWTSEVMTNPTTGNKYVQVPNEFLNGEYSRLMCYVIAEDETGQHTRTKEIFRIKKRQQPEDYEITFTDRVYIRDLKAIAERYRDQAKGYSEQAATSSTQAGQHNAQALESKNAAALSAQQASESMESAQSAQHGAESARNDANAILTLVQSKGTEITNFVTTSKTELEIQKNESLAEVRSVYTADLDELKGDLDNIGLYGHHSLYRSEQINGSYIHQIPVSIPKGNYVIKYDNLTSTDKADDKCLIAFWDSGNNVVKSINVPRNTSYEETIKLSKDIKNIYLYASTTANASAGDTFTYTNFNVLNTYISDRFDKLEYDIAKIDSLLCKDFYNITFQLNSISTTTGQNVTNNNHIRMEGLTTASESFYLSLTDKIKGMIYYYSDFSYSSYSSYTNLEAGSITFINKGTNFRLVLFYTDGSTPDISDILNNLKITYNILDRIERLDVNKEDDSWGIYGIDIASGITNSDNTYIHMYGYINKSSYSIVATGCYGVSIYVYNGNNEYIGCLNDNDVLSFENAKLFKSIDLTDFSESNPDYKYRITACRLNIDGNHINDIMTASESNNVKLFTPFEKKLYDEKVLMPLVSFVDDDVPQEALDNWQEIGMNTGIKCGFAVPTGGLSDDLWRNIERMYSAGYDFLSHTHNHINLMNETDESVIKNDLQASIEAFHNHGIDVKGLVYPQSSINNNSLSIVIKYFEFSFNGVDGIKSIQGNPMRHHNFTRTNTIDVDKGMIDYTDPVDGITYKVWDVLPLSTLKSYVDYAVENNCWIVFETHLRNSRTNQEGNDGFYYTEEIKQKMIDLIKYAVEKGCKVVTPTEGFNIMKNRLIRGSYGGGSYYIIDRNGELYRKNM